MINVYFVDICSLSQFRIYKITVELFYQRSCFCFYIPEYIVLYQTLMPKLFNPACVHVCMNCWYSGVLLFLALNIASMCCFIFQLLFYATKCHFSLLYEIYQQNEILLHIHKTAMGIVTSSTGYDLKMSWKFKAIVTMWP